MKPVHFSDYVGRRHLRHPAADAVLHLDLISDRLLRQAHVVFVGSGCRLRIVEVLRVYVAVGWLMVLLGAVGAETQARLRPSVLNDGHVRGAPALVVIGH